MGEAASANKDAASAFPHKLQKIIEENNSDHCQISM